MDEGREGRVTSPPSSKSASRTRLLNDGAQLHAGDEPLHLHERLVGAVGAEQRTLGHAHRDDAARLLLAHLDGASPQVDALDDAAQGALLAAAGLGRGARAAAGERGEQGEAEGDALYLLHNTSPSILRGGR